MLKRITVFAILNTLAARQVFIMVLFLDRWAGGKSSDIGSRGKNDVRLINVKGDNCQGLLSRVS
jgi:hypothetical protein